MKLYLLEEKNGESFGWDCMNGIVIRANSARQARRIAARMSEQEGPGVWMNPGRTKCSEVKQEGVTGMILADVAWG